ncbi:MAG TPA: molybdopterin-binding protein [Candidatus Limnocylindria bacterium]|nr:molybdopterin-binding protein [Candidatus Limnocylindria bacterium]
MRAIKTAAILAVGSELTTGVTRDTNSGDLARELTALGVRVLRSVALPDDLGIATSAVIAALADADLVVCTGGLGPTPDDLTREAIAAACELEVRVDDTLLAEVEALFTRRGIAMPDANRKQAWLIDGAAALPNGHGSAPGWWVDRPDGCVVIALPGPPREMWPMWGEHALPRLQAGRLGVERATHTLRLSGVGESALVALIGEDVLRGTNPQVATYARADAVDVVVSAESDGRSTARAIVEETVAKLRTQVGEFIFAEGDQTWADALGARLGARTLATVEFGTSGSLQALLGGASYLQFGELLADEANLHHAAEDLGHFAQRVREVGRADIGLALFARQNKDTHVRIAIATADGVEEMTRVAFLAGDEGRRRAALSCAAALWQYLGGKAP